MHTSVNLINNNSFKHITLLRVSNLTGPSSGNILIIVGYTAAALCIHPDDGPVRFETCRSLMILKYYIQLNDSCVHLFVKNCRNLTIYNTVTNIRIVCGNLLGNSASLERMSATDSHREQRQDLERPTARNYDVYCINTYTCSKHVMPRFYPLMSAVP